MLRSILAVLLLGLACTSALAQSWPSRPVRLVLSQPPGSSPDIVARLIAERLSKQWGQGVVVENRPGGQNVVGALAAAKAPADGYTFYYATTAALVINAYTFKSLPYDPRKDFASVGMIGQTPFVVAVNPELPAKSTAELIAYAKANPGKVSMATEGQKTFAGMMGEMFAKSAGISVVHVPYNGVQPGIMDTIAGRTQMTVQSIAAIRSHLQRNALRALAVTSPKEVPGLDQAPPLAGMFPGFEFTGWHAVVAPQGAPAEAIGRLNRDLDAALRDPEVAKRLSDLGAITDGAGTPAQLGQFIEAEHVRWSRLAKELGVVPE